MHPIEHLRYLARTSGLDPRTLVGEVAYALSSAPFDSAMLVVVARRLLERHGDVGQLWWLLAGVMTSSEPQTTAWELGQRLEDDQTYANLAGGIPSGVRVGIDRWSEPAADIAAHRADVELVDLTGYGMQPDIVVVEVAAASPGQVLVRNDHRAMQSITDSGATLWVVCPLGTRLPDQVVTEIAERSDSRVATLDVANIATVVSSDGVTEFTPGSANRALAPDGPLAPELLHRPVG